jgi:hypothetical protein
VLQDDLGFAPSQMLLVFRSETIPADSPPVPRPGPLDVVGGASLPNVTDVLLPDDNPGAISPDTDTAYVLVGLDLPPEEAQRLVRRSRRRSAIPASWRCWSRALPRSTATSRRSASVTSGGPS